MAALISGLVAYSFLTTSILTSNLARLLIGGIIILIIYIAILLLTRYISQDEKTALKFIRDKYGIKLSFLEKFLRK